ncbi:MAG: YceH family protein [Actinobacteria bacterium]|nr:YceH family protein [Actinomycetota bacterium]
MDLTEHEQRVAGCLIEKALTTPQQYPLTLNALTLACNQTSNRDPVVSYSEEEVEEAVRSLKVKGLARFVHPSHGRSVLRYQHLFDEVLGLESQQLALLACLLLRGPQTSGELRSRTDRMASFSSLSEVEAELDWMHGRDPALVERRTRRPGQKEDRYCHLLGTRGQADQAFRSPKLPPSHASYATATSMEKEPGQPQHSSGTTIEPPYQPEHLQAESGPDISRRLNELTSEIAALRRDLDELRVALGMDATREADQT